MRFICLVCLLLMSFLVKGQSIYVKVVEEGTEEPLPMVNVAVYSGQNLVQGGATDFDGEVIISPLTPGTYKVEVSYVGFQNQTITGVIVSPSKRTQINVKLKQENIQLESVIVAYDAPRIDADKTGCVISKADIYAKPIRGVAGQYSNMYSSGEYSSNNSDFGTIDLKSMSSGQTFEFTDKKPIYIVIDPKSQETYAQVEENAFLNTRYNPVTTFSVDVDKASYSNVRRFINNGEQPPKDAVRIEEMVNYFNYDYPSPEEEEAISTYTEFSQCPWDTTHQLLHIGLKTGRVLSVDSIQPSNFVFLIDVSGSMDDYNKLPLVKKTLKMVVDKMRPEDKISIVVYAGAAGCVLESTSGAFKPKIHQAINELRAGGSTAGGQGIELAYKIASQEFIKGGNNRIILATDGDFNVGVSSNESLERLIEAKRKSNVFLTVLGYGMGNYKDDKLELLANKGNGNYAYIDQIEEAKRFFLGNGFYSALYTLAKDVKLQLEFNSKYVKEYRLIGYENRMLANTDFVDDSKDAGEMGSEQGVTALYEIIPRTSKPKDKLKYLKPKPSPELFTLKIRYKSPEGYKSKKIEKAIKRNLIPFDETSDRFKLSASVAMFGLLLKDSKYKGTSTYEDVIDLAERAEEIVYPNERDEMVYLVELLKDMSVGYKE